jgi:hypothetical protein
MIAPIVVVSLVFALFLAILLWERYHPAPDSKDEERRPSLTQWLVASAPSEHEGTFAKRLLLTALPVMVRILFLIVCTQWLEPGRSGVRG